MGWVWVSRYPPWTCPIAIPTDNGISSARCLVAATMLGWSHGNGERRCEASGGVDQVDGGGLGREELKLQDGSGVGRRLRVR
ncbi:unnamed protein product [Linum trigynum]|uniref:Uncharacterized protein n=1 Tax=Linum trigynum TaxID=586398 RepID=A0AAV2FVE8_9ROSI